MGAAVRFSREYRITDSRATPTVTPPHRQDMEPGALLASKLCSRMIRAIQPPARYKTYTNHLTCTLLNL